MIWKFFLILVLELVPMFCPISHILYMTIFNQGHEFFYFYGPTESKKLYCNGLQVFPSCVLCDFAYRTGLVRLLEDTNLL
jgi:hypothetical protein